MQSWPRSRLDLRAPRFVRPSKTALISMGNSLSGDDNYPIPRGFMQRLCPQPIILIPHSRHLRVGTLSNGTRRGKGRKP
jgi:hypothetical protein